MADGNAEKEAFVSGLSGTTKLEVYMLLITTTLGLTLRHVCLLSSQTLRKWHGQYFVFGLFWEYTTIMLPGVLSFTIMSEHFLILLPILLTLIITLTLYIILSSRRNITTTWSFPFPRKPPFVSATRTWVNIYTAIAILAVDFHIFPRRFAKAETYGTGLMDVGVGAYIFILGAVSKEAKSTTGLSLNEYWRSILVLLKSRIWIFVLFGLLRVASVKAAHYQLHVSEYGVHWNFFFTMVTVKLLVTLFAPVISLIPIRHSYAIASLSIAIGYQLLLNYTGLREYILTGPNGDYSRIGIISANREGIFSCIGFLSIYCAGVSGGRFVFLRKSNSNVYIQRKDTREYWNILLYTISILILSIVITLMISVNVEEVSRRMANLSFVFWILSLLGLVTAMSLITELLVIYLSSIRPTIKESISPQYDYLYTTPSPHICLVSAIDYNQFTFFLLANLSTGLVNMSINTIKVGPLASLCIILLHTFGLSVISIVFKRLNIKLV